MALANIQILGSGTATALTASGTILEVLSSLR